MPNGDLARRARYFDNAATTPLDERVLDEMLPFFGEAFGNANSIHEFGRRAQAAVDLARQRISTAIGAEDASQVIFTSGATESNNQVLRSFGDVAVSPFEHSSVREPAKTFGLKTLGNEGLEVLPPEQPVELLSLMTVNNEIGAIWEARRFAKSAAYIHSDITQAVGKLPIDLEDIAFASFSAHKFYGPKGIGGLYLRETLPSPLLIGGEQEYELRGGTLNVPGIVGMGIAAELAGEEREQNYRHAEALRAVLLEGLGGCTDWVVLGGTHVSPYILSLSFLGVEGETLVIEVDRSGFAISSGAACSSHSNEPSHVLSVLGLEEVWSRGTVRISFGKYCTLEAAQELAKSLRQAVENIRRMDVS